MTRSTSAIAVSEATEPVFDTEVGQTYLDNVRRLHVSKRAQKAIEAAVASERSASQ